MKKAALALVPFLASCPLLPGPEDLVGEANVLIVVANVEDDHRVVVDVGGLRREPRLRDDDEVVEIRVRLPVGEHRGTITVFDDDDEDDDSRCGAFIVSLLEAASTDTVVIDVEALPRCDDEVDDNG